jgi:transglutaminase-like putative cysteine protease
LNQSLFESLSYRCRENGETQDTVTTLQSGQGACRDHAVALIDICRTLGLAARFVSGYVFTIQGDERADSNTMHAWAEVYLPGAGWKGLDPSRGILCADTYIPVAHAPVHECINPVQGSYYSDILVPSHLIKNVLVESLNA